MSKKCFAAAGLLALLAVDQLTKYLAVTFLKGTSGIPLISGIFELIYLENKGAAWGLFGGMKWFFLAVTVLLVALAVYVFFRTPDGKKYRYFRMLCVLLSAGALGNALDRIFRGYVVDFFYISLIDFPVFNVADCYITFSLVLFLILYRNEDFSWLKKS